MMRVAWNPNDCAIAAKQPMSWISQPQFLFVSTLISSPASSAPPLRSFPLRALHGSGISFLVRSTAHRLVIISALDARFNGFSTTEKVKPQDLIKSAEVLLQRRQFISHGYIKSCTSVKKLYNDQAAISQLPRSGDSGRTKLLRNPGPGGHRGGRGVRGPGFVFANAP
jgi:hypothetical protein